MINLTFLHTIPHTTLFLHDLQNFFHHYPSSNFLQHFLKAKRKGNLKFTLRLIGPSDESFEGVGEILGSGAEEGIRAGGLGRVGEQGGG
jgi:hypothetical protein